MKRAVVAIGALVLLGGVIWLVGFDDSDEPGPPPFSATDSQVRAECMMGTYVPDPAAGRLAAKPPPRDWSRIETAPGAFQPDRAVVQVTLRPKEPGEEITLTGIHFDAVRLPLRPTGTVFHRPSCRREVVGPAIEADLDVNPEIGRSSLAPGGRIGPGLQVPEGRPIRFPWTITLDRPLRLYLLAHAEHSYSDWSVRIPWESDSSEGVIRVDNGGRKYRIADSIGMVWLNPGAGEPWINGQPPNYTKAE